MYPAMKHDSSFMTTIHHVMFLENISNKIHETACILLRMIELQWCLIGYPKDTLYVDIPYSSFGLREMM